MAARRRERAVGGGTEQSCGQGLGEAGGCVAGVQRAGPGAPRRGLGKGGDPMLGADQHGGGLGRVLQVFCQPGPGSEDGGGRTEGGHGWVGRGFQIEPGARGPFCRSTHCRGSKLFEGSRVAGS